MWVLASASPRRKEILERLGISFRVRVLHTQEVSDCVTPEDRVQDLALQKALQVAQVEPDVPILAADTVVFSEGILEKPKDEADHYRMLKHLSGRIHDVYTGIAVITPDWTETAFEKTKVHFRTLSETEIRTYIASKDGSDKAGGYGIQDLGMLLVERIEGDFFNVMGLPVMRWFGLCRDRGLPLVEGW